MTTEQTLIEERSIDYVPLAERRGKVWHKGPFWFTGNFVFQTLVIGFVGPSLGLGMVWSAVAVTVGACIGTFFMAFHANQGPTMGLPQMIQSRAQFGRKGAIIPFLATLFVYVGFIAFGIILVTQVIDLYAPASKWIWYPIVVTVAIVIAIVGYDLLHFVQRWLSYVLVAVFGLLTVVSLLSLPQTTPILLPAQTWNWSAFLIQLSVAAGYNISYAVYVSDYSRYLPADTPSRKLISWTYLGAALSAVWLMSLGSILGSYLSGGDAIPALKHTGDLLYPGFGLIVVTVGALAQLTITAVNCYGTMLTGISAVDGFLPLRPSRRLRVVGLLIVGVAATLIALAVPDAYLATFNGFILLMLYFLVPWTAVNLVDFYLVRRGRYAITHIFRWDSIYGNWGWRGMVAYTAGFASMVPFFALPFFTGPIARSIGGADVSFVPGLFVAGGVYYWLSRSLDHGAEDRARKQSIEELNGVAELSAVPQHH